MKRLKKFIKGLLCKHEYIKIGTFGKSKEPYYKTILQCKHCRKIKTE